LPLLPKFLGMGAPAPSETVFLLCAWTETIFLTAQSQQKHTKLRKSCRFCTVLFTTIKSAFIQLFSFTIARYFKFYVTMCIKMHQICRLCSYYALCRLIMRFVHIMHYEKNKIIFFESIAIYQLVFGRDHPFKTLTSLLCIFCIWVALLINIEEWGMYRIGCTGISLFSKLIVNELRSYCKQCGN